VVYLSTDVGRTVPALISFITAKADSLIDLRVERPSLEERFLEITTEGASR
jgi:ABC-2 type transport system ATP-binding protein